MLTLIQMQVLRWFETVKAGGATADDCAHALGVVHPRVSPAVSFLAKKGLLKENGRRRRTRQGHTAVAYVLGNGESVAARRGGDKGERVKEIGLRYVAERKKARTEPGIRAAMGRLVRGLNEIALSCEVDAKRVAQQEQPPPRSPRRGGP